MPLDARQTLQLLLEGNARHGAGRHLHPRRDALRRAEVASAQRPIAAILACSDSRVPPEILFDQGLGDLFVVRVAGNVLSPEAVGSFEYAAEHLGVPLIVVLGHARCGAVKRAADGGRASGHLGRILDAIQPAVEEARKRGERDVADAAARIHALRSAEALRSAGPLLDRLVREGRLLVVAALYDLDTGRVELLNDRGREGG